MSLVTISVETRMKYCFTITIEHIKHGMKTIVFQNNLKLSLKSPLCMKICQKTK